MFNIQTYNQEMERELGKIAVYTNEYGYEHKIPKYEDIKSFLTSSHKQLLKQFLEGEVERLENSKKNIIYCQREDFRKGTMCENCENGISECIRASKDSVYNQALDDQITHYQNLIKELV